jgi:hypothetical protein
MAPFYKIIDFHCTSLIVEKNIINTTALYKTLRNTEHHPMDFRKVICIFYTLNFKKFLYPEVCVQEDSNSENMKMRETHADHK